MAASSSGVSSSDFPNVFAIVRARNSLAANRRAEELQPSRVTSAQQVNQINAFDIRQNERTEAGAASLAQSRQDLQEGKAGAGRAFAINHPEELTEIFEAQAKKREMDLNAFNTRIIAVGRFATGFAGSLPPDVTPEQGQQQYTQGREALLRRFPELTEEDVPSKPNGLFIRRAITAMSAVAELQKQAGIAQGQKIIKGGTGEPGETRQRRVNVAGPEGPVAPTNVAAPKTGAGGGRGSGTGPGEIKAADTNAIKAIINDRVGEFFDPRTNEIKVLDPERRSLALAILDEASRIFARGGVTHADAVTQAARKFDVQITEAAGAGDNRARPGPDSPKRTKQLEAFKKFGNVARDFVNKQ
jgi:hypothetical protein